MGRRLPLNIDHIDARENAKETEKRIFPVTVTPKNLGPDPEKDAFFDAAKKEGYRTGGKSSPANIRDKGAWESLEVEINDCSTIDEALKKIVSMNGSSSLRDDVEVRYPNRIESESLKEARDSQGKEAP